MLSPEEVVAQAIASLTANQTKHLKAVNADGTYEAVGTRGTRLGELRAKGIIIDGPEECGGIGRIVFSELGREVHTALLNQPQTIEERARELLNSATVPHWEYLGDGHTYVRRDDAIKAVEIALADAKGPTAPKSAAAA